MSLIDIFVFIPIQEHCEVWFIYFHMIWNQEKMFKSSSCASSFITKLKLIVQTKKF